MKMETVEGILLHVLPGLYKQTDPTLLETVVLLQHILECSHQMKEDFCSMSNLIYTCIVSTIQMNMSMYMCI